MMGLVPHIGRQAAHDVVYDACRDATQQNKSLYDVLSDMPQITDAQSDDETRATCDPANYTGLAAEMVDRMLDARKR